MTRSHLLRLIFHSLFAVLVTWWLFIYVRQTRGLENYWFNLFTAAFGLIGGALSLRSFFLWKNGNHRFAWGLLCFSLAVIFQSIGALIFAYYNFMNISEVPYPGIADLFYGAFPVLASAGVLFLLITVRSTVDEENFIKVLFHSVMPLLVIGVGISAFLTIAQVRPLNLANSGSSTFVLDLYYNVGDSLTLALGVSMLLSLSYYKTLGMRKALLALIAGFLTVYLADFTFIYRVNQDLYFVGDYPDIFYLATLYLISLGAMSFFDVPIPQVE